MTVTHGMNPDEVEQLGRDLQNCGDSFQTLAQTIHDQVRATSWEGNDAYLFKHQWWPDHLVALRTVGNELHGYGQSALNNAQEQRNISSTGGDGTGVARGGATTADVDRSSEWVSVRIPAGSHAAVGDYVNELNHLNEGQIMIREVAEGRYVVVLRGVDNLVGVGPNSLLTASIDEVGVDSQYQQQIRQAIEMADIPENAEIAIIGHSQGGIAAIEVAQGDLRVTDILTLGSPVGMRDIPDGVSVLSLENTMDAVPQIDEALGGDNYYLDPAVTTAKFESGALVPWNAHGVDEGYLAAVEAIEGGSGGAIDFRSSESEASAWIADFESRYGGDGSSSSAQVYKPGGY